MDELGEVPQLLSQPAARLFNSMCHTSKHVFQTVTARFWQLKVYTTSTTGGSAKRSFGAMGKYGADMWRQVVTCSGKNI
jgi:hypothetical protein